MSATASLTSKVRLTTPSSVSVTKKEMWSLGLLLAMLDLKVRVNRPHLRRNKQQKKLPAKLWNMEFDELMCK
jgi:hypothetical protein